MSGGSPWADPATETEQVAYAGPPATAAPGYPPAGYAPPGYGWAPPPAPYWAAYGPPVPARPRRPGQLVAAAVLSFVQAALVALSSAYLVLLAVAAGALATEYGTSTEDDALVTEAVVLTVVQLLSAIGLVIGGILVLNRRSRGTWLTLVVTCAVQLALALYWAVRLTTLDGFTDELDGPGAALVAGVLFYAAAPAVALGLLLVPAVRRWATGDAPAGSAP